MVVAQINALCGAGSTGKICASISQMLREERIDNYILYSIGHSNYANSYKFSNRFTQKSYALYSRVYGDNGFNAHIATRNLIKRLEEIKPNIIHLHNIHSNDINLELLFDYIKSNKIEVIWTFHDCWAFTGYCMHFDYINCTRWNNKCHNCPQRKKYSWFVDRSEELFQRKRTTYGNYNMTIISPSNWLAELARKSFLGRNDVRVINNGIDLSIFHKNTSDWREIHSIKKKYMVLGVSFEWSEKKGLKVIQYLAEHLDEDYQLVLVGTDERIDKLLPDNIISIHRTSDQNELVKIYTAADVFVNPTLEENFPTVNMESIACGTPVVSFDTGGSVETIPKGCGLVVEKGNNQAMKSAIVNVCENNACSREACLRNAQFFDMKKRFSEYVDLYNEINSRRS